MFLVQRGRPLSSCLSRPRTVPFSRHFPEILSVDVCRPGRCKFTRCRRESELVSFVRPLEPQPPYATPRSILINWPLSYVLHGTGSPNTSAFTLLVRVR